MIDPFFEDLTDDTPRDKMTRYHDFREVFTSEVGIRVLRDIYQLAETNKSPAHKANFDPHETMYRDGARGLVLRMIDLINHEPVLQQIHQRKK